QPRATRTHNASEGFRAMPPMRPADFYRGLQRGQTPAGAVAERTAEARSSLENQGRKETATTNAANSEGHAVAEHQHRPNVAASIDMPRAAARAVKTSTSAATIATTGTLAVGGVAATLPAASMAVTSTGGYRHAIRHEYHEAIGALVRVKECRDGIACEQVGQVYWQLDEVDVNGAATRFTFGNGIVTTRGIDRVTGLVSSIQAI